MVGNFAALKLMTRQTVHNVLAVSAFYRATPGSTEIACTARHHTKGQIVGDLDASGYATMIENINRIVFNVPEVTSLALDLRQGGVVRFPDYGLSFRLDTRDDPASGPVETIWNVVKA